MAGMSPLPPLAVLPDADQNIQLIMVPKMAGSLMVTVKDQATGLPLTDSLVTVDAGAGPISLTTGQGYFAQTDWSGGSGQEEFTDPTQYSIDDGNIDKSLVPGEVRLRDVFGLHQPFGELASSIFDTGASSNFYQLTHLPLNQPLDTAPPSVKLQFATANSTSSLSSSPNFLGPDGTAATFYTSTTTDINSAHNGNRYFRYKLMLSTASSSYTPTVSDARVTFTTSCTPPGQVLFQGLPDGIYGITVSHSGYLNSVDTASVNTGTPW